MSVPAAHASIWEVQSQTAQMRVSGFAIPGIGMTLYCFNQPGAPSFVDFYFGQDIPLGPATFQVDGGMPITITFPDGPFVADNPANAATFNELVQELKRGSNLTVSNAGEQISVSLAGSSRAIGDCEAQLAGQVQPSLPAPSSARWFSESGQGLRDASVTVGEATLGVLCSVASPLSDSEISLRMAGHRVTGPVRFTFSDGSAFDATFADGEMSMASSDDAATFTALVETIRSGGSVTVALVDGTSEQFPLQGAGEAIGGSCPAPQAAASESAQSEAPAPRENPKGPRLESAREDGTSTQPRPVQVADGFIDYRIDECAGQPGLIMFQERHGSLTEIMSDFCFDSDTGTFISAEPLNGLELSVSSESTQIFENFDSEDQYGDRDEITIYPEMGDLNAVCTVEGIGVAFYNLSKNTAEQLNAPSGLLGMGYAYGDVATALPTGTYQAFVQAGGVPMNINGEQRALSDFYFSGATVWGELELANNRGVVQFAEERSQDSAANHSGMLTITAEEDGSLRGSGNLSWENPRLRGHQPREWISVNAEFVGLRGHMIGPNAEVLKLRGWLQGEFVDITGATNTFVSQIEFEACQSPTQ